MVPHARDLFQSSVVISTRTLFIHSHRYKSHIDMCRTKGHGFLHCFGLKTGIDFAHFSLASGKVFIGTTGVYEIRFVGVLIQVMVT